MEDFELLFDAMDRADVKPWEFLQYSDDDLSRRTGRGIYDIKKYKEQLLNSQTQPLRICGFKSNTIPRNLNPISTGIAKLDDLLGGGLQRGSVTEVSGPATAGKTCLCCQISVRNAKSLYLTSEERVRSLQRRMEYMANTSDASPESEYPQDSTAVFMKMTSLAELKVALATLKYRPYYPEVILIDSLAALLDSQSINVEEQLELLQLRKIAFELQAAIVLVNHVRESQRPDAEQLADCEYLSQAYWVQGDARPNEKFWAHSMHGVIISDFIDNRLLLIRKLPESSNREARLVFSKQAAPGEVILEMTSQGLV